MSPEKQQVENKKQLGGKQRDKQTYLLAAGSYPSVLSRAQVPTCLLLLHCLWGEGGMGGSMMQSSQGVLENKEEMPGQGGRLPRGAPQLSGTELGPPLRQPHKPLLTANEHL